MKLIKKVQAFLSTKKQPTKTTARTGIRYAAKSYDSTPQDIDHVLKNAGLQRSDLLKLLYDDEISSCTERRISAVLGNGWHIEGDKTDWLYNVIAEIHESAVRSIMAAKWIGSSIGEIVYQKTEEGLITIEEIVPRKIESFRREQGVLYWLDESSNKVATVPEKILFAGVNVHSGNPYGDSLLSRIYWAWFSKNYGYQFWSKFVERHASPLSFIKAELSSVDPQRQSQELSELAAAIAAAVSAGVVAAPDTTDIQFLEASGNGEAHEKNIRHQIQRIQKTILGRVLTSELENGSRAAQEADDRFYQEITESDLNFCEKGLNHIVRSLLLLNGQSADEVYFTYDRRNIIDQVRVNRDVALLQTGKIELSEQYYLDQYGFEKGQIILKENGGSPTSLSLSHHACLSGHEDLPPAAQEMEDLITNSWKIQDSKVIKAAMTATSAADLVLKLQALYEEEDDPEDKGIVETANALAMASAKGYFDAEKGRI